jgi:hypothetical protein
VTAPHSASCCLGAPTPKGRLAAVSCGLLSLVYLGLRHAVTVALAAAVADPAMTNRALAEPLTMRGENASQQQTAVRC